LTGADGDTSRWPPRLILAAALAVCIVGGLSIWDLSISYRNAYDDTEASARNLARAFASHASRSVGETSRIIDGIGRAVVAEPGATAASEGVLHAILRDRLIDAPQLQGVVIVDSNGFVVAGSRSYPEQRVDVSDRDYFKVHREDSSTKLRIGSATGSRITGEWFIASTARLEDPDGVFLGVVVAALSPGYFSSFYNSVALPGQSFVELLHENSNVLAREPADDAVMGQPSVVAATSMPAVARIDAIGQRPALLVAQEAVPDLPLAVLIAVDLEAALVHWKRHFWQHGALNVGAVVALLLLLLALHRRTSLLASSEAMAQRLARERDSVISSMADAVIVADANGKIVGYNPAATVIFDSSRFLESPDEQLGRQGVFLPDGATPFPPEDLPLARAIRGEQVDNVEICLRNDQVPDGARLLLNARPIKGPDGEIEGGVVVCRDITAVRETEHRLIQAQKMESVGQITGGVAHDFNNILTVVIGNIEMLGERIHNDPESQRIVDAVLDAAGRGADLTSRLLAFSKRQTLQPRIVDVNKLVNDTHQLLLRVLGENIEIRTELQPDTWPAIVDSAHLQSALLNLAVNARDAMPEGGKLTIETGNTTLDEHYAASNPDARLGDFVMLAISDTGTGIAPGFRDQVFEPFFTTKEVGRGSGLGLSMVYGFSRQSGGHVKIYSEQGHGTVVRLYLPRSTKGAAVQAQAPAAPKKVATAGSETILVVEDDALVRSFVMTQLKALGYRTLAGSTGAEGLAQLESEKNIALLFTDVVLPGGMNGRQLADEARRRWPHLKVLYTSGYTENAIVHHGRLDPGIRLLSKPYRLDELASAVRAALDSDPD
jgi:signal transduction histidine kinase/ActR/RegA family two-component response regulator